MSKKRTTEEFKEEVKKLTGDEYIVIGEYIGTNSKIKIQHNTCRICL
jgi:hypothetical protein